MAEFDRFGPDDHASFVVLPRRMRRSQAHRSCRQTSVCKRDEGALATLNMRARNEDPDSPR